ncbi:hypothetical protein N7G274_010816 [Stereocaulon virgatum]|uniref:Uncharacterized protein n=1 Tax=Stereocaulon virgatum TaxID=373712 RepID=A0ABR3ZSU9_9LECA
MTAEKAKEMLLEGHRRGIDQLKEGEARALVGKFGKQQKNNKAASRPIKATKIGVKPATNQGIPKANVGRSTMSSLLIGYKNNGRNKANMAGKP